MSDLFNANLIKSITDFAVFLEFTSDDLLDADAAVSAMEQLAAELQRMTPENQRMLTKQLKNLSAEYQDKEKTRFVENLPSYLGLEE